MNMRPTFDNAADVLAQYDALSDRAAQGQPVALADALSAASALAVALRAALMTTTAAPRAKRPAKPLTFDMTAESLAKALRLAMRACVTGGRQTFPILSAVRLQARGDVLALTCNDTDCAITVEVCAPGVGDWSAVVNAKALAGVIGKAKGQVVLRADGEALQVSGAVSAQIAGLSLADWPRDPVTLREPVAVPISPADLRDLLAAAAPAMSLEATRYYLNGAYLHAADGQFIAVATDGHRLHRSRCEQRRAATFPAVIIPHATVGDLLALLAAPGEGFAFHVAAEGVALTCGAVSLVSKIVDGSFPDYARVFPSGRARVIEVAAAALDAALAQAATVAGKNTTAHLTFSADGLEVAARALEGAATSAQIGARGGAGAPALAINARLLREAVAAMETDAVALHVYGAADAVEVRPINGADRAALVMPLRR